MLADLAAVARGELPTPKRHVDHGPLPFRLLCRRLAYVYNSSFHDEVTHRGRGFNPAFMHPADLAELGLSPGQTVVISNHVGSIRAVVEADADLRRGVVSMSFGFGGPPGADEDFLQRGVSTSRLVSDTVNYDRYSGQPQMSNLPVMVSRLDWPVVSNGPLCVNTGRGVWSFIFERPSRSVGISCEAERRRQSTRCPRVLWRLALLPSALSLLLRRWSGLLSRTRQPNR
jgi:hypothetical protein